MQEEKPLLFTCVRRASLPETVGEMWKKKKEKEEEKEEEGKLILMLGNRLGVDVFEIPLQKKKKKKRVGALQRERFLSRETHLAAGWPSVACAGPQKATSASDGGAATWLGVFVWTCGWRRDRGRRGRAGAPARQTSTLSDNLRGRTFLLAPAFYTSNTADRCLEVGTEARAK